MFRRARVHREAANPGYRHFNLLPLRLGPALLAAVAGAFSLAAFGHGVSARQGPAPIESQSQDIRPPQTGMSEVSFLAWLRTNYSLGPDDTLSLMNRGPSLIRGLTFARYAHLYKGLRVEDDEVTIHLAGDAVQTAFGKLTGRLSLSTQPSLSPDRVLRIAEAAFEAAVASTAPVYNTAKSHRCKLAIHKGRAGNLVLVHGCTMVSTTPSDSYLVVIEDTTSQVLSTMSTRERIWSPASAWGQTFYYGTQGPFDVETDEGALFRLHGPAMRSQHSVDPSAPAPTIQDYESPTPFFAGTSNGIDNSAGASLQWGMAVTLGFWQALLNIDPLQSFYDQCYGPAIAYGGLNPNDPNYFAYFFDCYIAFKDNLVALDAIGHELAHMVAARRNASGWTNLERRALHESFADIMGELSEASVLGSSADWVMAIKVPLQYMPQPAPYYRDFSDPKLYFHPEAYQGQYWSATDYHLNATVSDRWFYLLAFGGSGVTGIGDKTAAATSPGRLTSRSWGPAPASPLPPAPPKASRRRCAATSPRLTSRLTTPGMRPRSFRARSQRRPTPTPPTA